MSSGTYEYNALNQLALRSTTAADTHSVYDRDGHLIAEADAASGDTVREYVRLADMPVAVVADVDTASPIVYSVHADHLNRPVMMTDGLKANVWEVQWLPYGAAHAITGAASLEARFPVQWFQIETGFHYNWHRHYDPTLGRYTQADPLGFVDGPSLYAYAVNSPQRFIDFDGRMADLPISGPTLRRSSNPRLKLPPRVDFPPKAPKGTPTEGIPQRLPRSSRTPTCERWLIACNLGCRTSRVCQRVRPLASACHVGCFTSYALCAGLKHFSEVD